MHLQVNRSLALLELLPFVPLPLCQMIQRYFRWHFEKFILNHNWKIGYSLCIYCFWNSFSCEKFLSLCKESNMFSCDRKHFSFFVVLVNNSFKLGKYLQVSVNFHCRLNNPCNQLCTYAGSLLLNNSRLKGVVIYLSGHI